MTYEGLGEMFEGDFKDMCVKKFMLMSMGGQAEGLACADPRARTGVSGNYLCFWVFTHHVLPLKMKVKMLQNREP